MRTKRIKKKVAKLNLIPILDSVFIFIFFLLMSAQFIEIYEIGTDAPLISNQKPPKNKKEPLNLQIKVSNKNIVLLTGANPSVYKTIKRDSDNQYKELRAELIKIKTEHMEESTVILKPNNKVEYADIIKIIDSAKQLSPEEKKSLKLSDKNLFKNIVFETQG